MNDADVEAIRAGFPALNREIYLNAGTYGPLPTVVADTLRDWYTMLEQEGPWAPPAVKRSHEECETTRRKVADLLGADPEEIALTRSTSEGTDIIGYGIRWREGDEVIVSDQEHEGCWIVWQSLSRRYGIRVRVLPLTEDQDELLSRLEAMMTPRTRLVFLSHVSCQSGLRILPAPIGRLVHEHGAFFMLDGAHAVGQFPVDVRALNCDFYTGCGHKWLMGPQGTGFLYIAHEHLEEVEPTWVGWGVRSSECRGPKDERLLWADGGHRYEFSTRCWALYAGLGSAIDLIQRIGLTNIEARVQSLVGPFKRALAELPRVRVVTPFDPRLSTGLVKIEMTGYQHEALSNLYTERRMLVPYYKREDGVQGMRFAVAFFTLQRELDAVLEMLKELAS